MSKTEQAIVWMENTARDNSHGYDQIYRWGEKGDYDCSAAVITAWDKAGVPVKKKGASYTGNLRKAFLACGFKDVTKTVSMATGAGLLRGDVLLKEGKHVAMYCGNGKEVEASINEKGTAKGGKPGDQTGREFLIRSYRNYPWSHVLRYQESNSGSTAKGNYEVCNCYSLNVRREPGGLIVGTVNKGDKLQNDGETKVVGGKTWYKVTVIKNGVVGWVSGAYIKKI